MDGISPELDQLSCALIGAGMQLLEEEGQLPVLLSLDCEEDFLAFDDDTPDACYRAACTQVAERGVACNRYAILYPGVIQEDDASEGYPALVVEFAERGMEQAWSGYLLYRYAEDGTIEVADPLPGGAEELLFA